MKKILLSRELIEELKKNPNAPVLCGAWNGYVETYAGVDYVHRFKMEELQNDFYGTPGRMDKRVLTGKSEEVFYIGSLFGRVPNPDIDFGENNIDYEISKINGESGDPNLVWKLNGFESGDGVRWIKEGDGWKIEYDTSSQTLDAHNYRESMRFVGKVIGIETLRNIISTCKIDLTVRI